MSRNMIDYNTGVVKTYALGTVEHLPSETYLFSYLEDDGKTVDGSQTAFGWITQKLLPPELSVSARRKSQERVC